jgi:hypothetical protein
MRRNSFPTIKTKRLPDLDPRWQGALNPGTGPSLRRLPLDQWTWIECARSFSSHQLTGFFGLLLIVFIQTWIYRISLAAARARPSQLAKFTHELRRVKLDESKEVCWFVSCTAAAGIDHPSGLVCMLNRVFPLPPLTLCSLHKQGASH